MKLTLFPWFCTILHTLKKAKCFNKLGHVIKGFHGFHPINQNSRSVFWNYTWFWSTLAHLLQTDQLLIKIFIATIFICEATLYTRNICPYVWIMHVLYQKPNSIRNCIERYIKNKKDALRCINIHQQMNHKKLHTNILTEMNPVYIELTKLSNWSTGWGAIDKIQMEAHDYTITSEFE